MNAIEQAIYNLLTADAMLITTHAIDGVYEGETHNEADTRYIIIQQQTGVPAGQTFAGRLGMNRTYLIKVVGEGLFSEGIDNAAWYMDGLLERASLNISGQFQKFGLRLETEVKYRERVGNKTWHHIGGRYRLATA